MPELLHPILILLIGLATGFVDGTVGGGGLLSIPSLMLLGLPPQVAIATDRLGSLGETLASLSKYAKAKKIVWKYVPPLIILAIFNSFLGAKILFTIDPATVQKIVSALILVLLPLIFIKPNLGLEQIATSKWKKIIGFIIYFLLMILAATFGAGVGPLVAYAFMYFFGFTMITASATKILPYFFLSVSSVAIFARHGLIDYKNGVIFLIGMTIGGYLGAHTALQKGDRWVKRLFALVVVLSGIKLLFS